MGVPAMPTILADRYLLVEERQSGGMATVYKARDIKTDGLVAVKRFDRDKHLPEIEAEAYRRDVEALKNISHPNVVQLLDSGEDENGKPFLVLEWMPCDLLEYKQRGERAFDGWDDFAEQIALPLVDALAYLHAQSFSHRDVHPGNILVAEDGTIKLADFGISKLKKSLLPRVTLKGFGLPPYTPPEVDDDSFSYARDVHAFGVLCLWRVRGSDQRISTDTCRFGRFQCPRGRHSRDYPALCAYRPGHTPPNGWGGRSGIGPHAIEEEPGLGGAVRKRCYLRVIPKVLQMVTRELGNDEEEAFIKRFVETDINDAATFTRFFANLGKPDERLVPDNYYIYGSRASYQIAPDRNGADYFVVLNARFWQAHQIQRFKEGTPPSPLSFELVTRSKIITIPDALELLETTLSDHEHRCKQERERKEEAALFTIWKSVLDAKADFERHQCKPIRFNGASVDGRYVGLSIEGDLEGVELDQARVIRTEGMWISGTIVDMGASKVILRCPSGDLSRMPKAGEAALDTRAADIAIDRQRAAIEMARTGSSLRGDLRVMLLDPATFRVPVLDDEKRKASFPNLDASQRDAMIAALECPMSC